VISSGIGQVHAVPVDGAGTAVASPSPTVTGVSETSSSSSSILQNSSTTTGTVPGTVVTDSPLVRTRSDSLVSESASTSGGSLLRNQSSTASATGAASMTGSSTAQSQTILPSPTTNDNDSPSSTPQVNTYNSLVNFYFLILAGFIGFAVLGWYIWRRRRRGKTTRDQRRGLEALRRDIELGRLRRGFLGVVGRGGNNTQPPATEELPAYVI
jgi:hypothetical protein